MDAPAAPPHRSCTPARIFIHGGTYVHLKPLRRSVALLLAVATLSGACTTRDDNDTPPQQPAAQPVPATPDFGAIGTADSMARQPTSDMRIEVDLASRQLHVMRGSERVATHSVAVGSQQWPTRTGEWSIGQVVLNPEWIPPDESWAEEREPRKPGDPKNPLGHAQLVYDAPRSIHGTNDPSSIGKAVSHGSIRVTNEVAVELARQVMEAGGAARDDAWFARARQNRSEKQIVQLPNPVPIRVQ
jgi:lipoprotein-anchoring transpeptidase ErfK/SrfK